MLKDDIQDELNKILNQVARYGMARMKYIVKSKSKYPTDNYQLWKDTKYKIDDNIIVIDMPIRGWAVDEGRAPGEKKIPIKAIMDFIKRRNIVSAISLTSLAFAIQTSIFKKGIKPRAFIDESLKDMEDMLIDLLSSPKFINSIAEELLKKVTINKVK